MTKYHSSSSHYIAEAIIVSGMLLGIGIALTYATNSMLLKTMIISSVSLLVILIMIYQLIRTFDIYFLEERIHVKYFFPKRNMYIPYADLQKIEYIAIPKSPNANRITFRGLHKKNSLRFLSVAHSDAYIDFIKWLKSKNDEIELRIHPDDHILNHKIQEVYGARYRKIVRDTL